MKFASISIFTIIFSFKLIGQNTTHLGLGLGNLIKSITYGAEYEPSYTRTGFDFQLRHERSKSIAYYLEYTYLSYTTAKRFQFSHEDDVHQPKIKVAYILTNGKYISHEIGSCFSPGYHRLNRTYSQGDQYGNLYRKKFSATFPVITLGINYHYTVSYKKFKLLIGSELGKVINNDLVSKYGELQLLGIHEASSGLYFNMDIELYFKLK